LRVFLRSDQPIEGVAKRLEPAQRAAQDKGDAEISMILILEAGVGGRGEASRPLQGLAADRRRHQGGPGRDRVQAL
jgi:hypothetical protein